jgi:hypothetical protein
VIVQEYLFSYSRKSTFLDLEGDLTT